MFDLGIFKFVSFFNGVFVYGPSYTYCNCYDGVGFPALIMDSMI